MERPIKLLTEIHNKRELWKIAIKVKDKWTIFKDGKQSFELVVVDAKVETFKFSLTGRAKDWLDTIPPGTIATWQDLERKFKDRYFPIHKFLERRSEIMNFEQGDSETLYDAWERFKLCLKKCPDHGIDELQQMQYFTQGLRPQTRMLLDASAGGSLKNKDEVEAKELVETMTQNEYRAQNDRGAKKKAGILELDTNNAILAQMKLMSKEMEELKKASSRGSQASVNQFEEVKCDFCRGGHENGKCFPEGSEQAKYLANFRKSYPNNQGYGCGNQGQNSNSNPPARKPSPMEESINKFIQVTQESIGELKTSQLTMQKHNDASIKNLETQMGQLSRQFSELMSQGTFGGNTKDNPWNEQCKTITLRKREVPSPQLGESHKKKEKNKVQEGEVEKEELSENKNEGEVEKSKESEVEESGESDNEGEVEKLREKKVRSEEEDVVKEQKARQEKGKGKEASPNIKLPYPRKKKAKAKDHSQFKKFMKLLNTLQLNVPLVEALEQMPLYSKFLKELLTKKRKPLDDDTVDMTEECSALIQRKLPQKKKDPGSFTIPCSIGNLCIGRALCDLGSIINLMSLTMMKKIPGAVAKPTRMQLSLADRSIVYPYGILHDVLVRVGEFIFPADFIIMDMTEDREVESLLLGRPFLATGRALIDVEMGELMLRTDEEKIMFNVFEAMKRHDDESECFRVDVIEEVVEDVHVEEQPTPPLERVIVNSIEKVEDEFEEEIEECLRQLEANLVDSNPKVEEVLSGDKEEVAQEDKAKTVELKELLSHLKYVFLGENGSNPAIISSSLARLEESKLLRVLRANKEAMGWAISDLKGISPTVCMHKIKMEDEYKPVVQPQRRLNPTMKEVVKKEFLKLLEAGMIYPISDSEWVSPVHVVSKKGGMTVIRNDKNELIPTRTVTGWRMCIDYRRLNKATRKDHYPLPFMDQMLERLAGQEYYCFLDGYSGYNQIEVDPRDQEKTAFTCPFGMFAYRRMPFGLCNAPATFQRCMQAIFSDMMEDTLEVFMDDFSVFGKSFDSCLDNLNVVLKRCIDTNIILNWEKCHFMVKEGIVLGHKVSSKGIEVDQAKIEVIKELPPPVNVKGVRSFLGHAGFYQRFIKDFSNISKPLCALLVKDSEFKFDDDCLNAFEILKEKLVSTPIIVAPQWDLPFELMCDASDYAVGAVLGQHRSKFFHAIYYASKVLNENQVNYTTTEKELLAIVFALEKFRSYLIGSKVIVFTDHAALRHLLTKNESKPRLLRWILLLQEFDIEIKDKKGVENVVADHLSRLENPLVTTKEKVISEAFPDEHLLAISTRPWFADLANYKVSGELPEDLTSHQRKKFLHDSKFYFWDDPFLFKEGQDGIIRRCVDTKESLYIMWHWHNSPCGGHHSGQRTAAKVLQSGFFWPTLFKDCVNYVKNCDKCQRTGTITKRDEMPLQGMLEVEPFDCWGVDFMGPFPSSKSNLYILVCVDYVTKWVEAIASPKNDAHTVVKFLKKNIFSRFGVPRVLISDGELEHKAYWATKFLNMDESLAGRERLLKLNELEEWRCRAYENAVIYKARTKAYHDKALRPKEFHKGQQVLLFNSRLKLFPGKLKSKWSGPFVIKEVSPYGSVEIFKPGEEDQGFKVNGQRLKVYQGGEFQRHKVALIFRKLVLENNEEEKCNRKAESAPSAICTPRRAMMRAAQPKGKSRVNSQTPAQGSYQPRVNQITARRVGFDGAPRKWKFKQFGSQWSLARRAGTSGAPRHSTEKRGGGSSSRQEPPPPPQVDEARGMTWAEKFVRNNRGWTAPYSERFFRENHHTRYLKLKALKINQEKAFKNGLREVPEVYGELERRGWLLFNSLMDRETMSGNLELVREFFANAYHGDATRRVYVRGVLVDYSGDAINRFLRTTRVNECAYMPLYQNVAGMSYMERKEVTRYVGRPLAPWYKYYGGTVPTKIHIHHFYDHGAIGYRLLSMDIRRTSKIEKPSFRLGHCNLITALCRDLHVPELDEDDVFHPVAPLTFETYRSFSAGPVPEAERAKFVEEDDPEGGDEDEEDVDELLNSNANRNEGEGQEDDALMAEIDGFVGDQEIPTQHHEAPQGGYHYTHHEDELARMLHELDLYRSTGATHIYYNQQGSLYQDAMRYREEHSPPSDYELYPTRGEWEDYVHNDRERYEGMMRRRSREWERSYLAHNPPTGTFGQSGYVPQGEEGPSHGYGAAEENLNMCLRPI
ncbi:hypothetical protein TSUD_15800 [Trifolium subterraneum]|uniref:RNA-directed DNA polymerase n=1 Tax=Trifolium subterraneum TaxID=3900 RepID=A0A2Z6P2I9_TRISU|nr:hypothetical protein TSUD_15800 [Trifolium subterraneum]